MFRTITPPPVFTRHYMAYKVISRKNTQDKVPTIESLCYERTSDSKLTKGTLKYNQGALGYITILPYIQTEEPTNIYKI